MNQNGMVIDKSSQPYLGWQWNGSEWVPPRLNPVGGELPGENWANPNDPRLYNDTWAHQRKIGKPRVIIRNPGVYNQPTEPIYTSVDPNPIFQPHPPFETLPATTNPTKTPTDPTTGDDLLFGFPKMYVYIGGALVAAAIVYYMTISTGKK